MRTRKRRVTSSTLNGGVLANAVRDFHDIHHLGHTMDADDVRTEQDACGYRSRSSPFAPGRVPFSDGRGEERFARRTTQDGAVEPGQRLERPQRGKRVFGLLGETQPGVDHDDVSGYSSRPRALDRLFQLTAHLRRDVFVYRFAVHVA